MLAAARQKTREWFGPAGPESATAGNVGEPSRGSPPPVVGHDVVPPKYRVGPGNALGNTSAPALARDATASPSLVRPSRRPPPDPAPKLPEETVPVIAATPVTTGPLFDRIASASRAWQNRPAAAAAASPSQQPVTQPLVTDTQLKFTAPDPGAREPVGVTRDADPASVTRHTDIMKNVLRPAKSPASAGNSSPAAATDPTVNPLVNSSALAAANDTAWTARPNPATSRGESPVPPATTVTSDVAAHVAQSTGLLAPTAPTLVANSSPQPARDASGDAATAVPAAPPAAAPPDEVAAAAPAATTVRSPSAPVAAAPSADPVRPEAGSLVTSPFAPPRSERAPSWPDVAPQRPRGSSTAVDLPQIPKLAALPTKSRPVARPSLAAHPAAAPPVAEELAADESLAPLIDADEYRAQFIQPNDGSPAPVHTASRSPQTPAAGSWLAAFERLRQSTSATPPPAPPKAPAGSPGRSLRSDDYVPPIPEMPAPILRR
jgi:hypothetical protein